MTALMSDGDTGPQERMSVGSSNTAGEITLKSVLISSGTKSKSFIFQ